MNCILKLQEQYFKVCPGMDGILATQELGANDMSMDGRYAGLAGAGAGSSRMPMNFSVTSHLP